MQGRIRERDAALVEVVAHGNLSAEGITAAVQVHFVVLVIACLYQHRHMQFGAADGIDDAHLEAEVGQ